MIVGTVRELKVAEYRVGLTPEGADALVRAGHVLLVESGAGIGSGFSDEAYRAVGAEIVASADDVWRRAELLIKVKEPVPAEFRRLRSGQVLFTYLHLAAAPEVARALMDAGGTAIVYETVELANGSLPLLIPMSEIAGRLATEAAGQWLRKPGPGRGKLLSGLPGAPPAHVVILGAGTVSSNACAVAVALGARVTVISKGLEPLRRIEERWPGRVTTLGSNAYNIDRALEGADALISGVLVTGARAPRVVTREQVRRMGEGAVVVAVDIDQGGSVETARATTHEDPVYVEEGVVHYGVANMPGSVPHTSTGALTAATLPYVLRLADGGQEALRADPALMAGLNVAAGKVTKRGVAEALNLPLIAPEAAL
ncbi:MAG: alanine dehydrogenase [Dehalococcoidia bacterium]